MCDESWGWSGLAEPCPRFSMFSGAGSSQLCGRCESVLFLFFFLIKQVETAGEFSSEPTASKQWMPGWLLTHEPASLMLPWKLHRLRPARIATVLLTSQFMALLLENNEGESTISQSQRMPLKVRCLPEVSWHSRTFFSACTLTSS